MLFEYDWMNPSDILFEWKFCMTAIISLNISYNFCLTKINIAQKSLVNAPSIQFIFYIWKHNFQCMFFYNYLFLLALLFLQIMDSQKNFFFVINFIGSVFQFKYRFCSVFQKAWYGHPIKKLPSVLQFKSKTKGLNTKQ